MARLKSVYQTCFYKPVIIYVNIYFTVKPYSCVGTISSSSSLVVVCVVTRVALSQVSHTPDIIPNRRPGRHSPQRACDPVYRQTVDRRDRWRPNLPRPSFAWGLAAARRRPPELRHALGLTAPQAVLGAAEEERGDMHQRQHLRGDQGPPGSARRAPSKASAAPEVARGGT